MEFFFDLCFCLYFSIGVVYLYGTVIFISWWIRTKKASSVYIYTAFLNLSMTFLMFSNAYARALKFINGDIYDLFVSSTYWANRLWPILIVGIMLHAHLTLRYILSSRGCDLDHYTNPLHVFCRLRDLKVPSKVAQWIGKKYEALIGK